MMPAAPWRSVGPELRAVECRRHDRVMVRLAGELDMATAPEAEQLLTGLARHSRTVVVDLAWVTFCDVAGLRCLLAAHAAVSAGGGTFVLRRAHRRVRRLLGLTGLAERFGGAVDDSEEGLAVAPAAVVDILEETIDSAAVLGRASMVNAQVVSRDGRGLRIVAQRGFYRPFLDFFEVVDSSDSACGAALTDEKPVWVSDVSASDIFSGTPALDTMLDAGSRAVGSIPVRLPTGELVAMFSVHRQCTGGWTSSQRSALAALGRFAGRQLASV